MENRIFRIQIIMALCLCCISANAAEKIPTPELQRQCAEYVAIKYTDTFIKSLVSDKYYPNYHQQFPAVDKWNIQQCHNNIEDYCKWLRENNFPKTYNGLTDKILDRQCFDIDSLLLLSTESYNKVCSDIRPQLKHDIEAFVKESQTKVEPSMEASTSKAYPNTLKLKNKNTMTDYLLWILGALCLINLTLLVVLFRKTSRERIINTIMESGRVKRMINMEKGAVNAPMNTYQIDEIRSQLGSLNQSINSLRYELDSLKKSACNQPQEVFHKTTVSPEINSNAKKIIYAKSYGSGRLKEWDENKAQYKIYVSNEGVSEFEFSGSFERAKSNSDATFDGVCTLQGVDIEKAKSYTIVARGTVIKSGDEWQVKDKAVIKFS